MKILHILATVDPAAGGPTEGVKRRGLRLKELGHEVEVVSLDDPRAEYVDRFCIPVHAMGPGKGFYGYTPRLIPWLKLHSTDYDAVVVNGLWQFHSLAASRGINPKIPYFVFTHGMLDPWFKSTYPLKHLKKWLYWPWADYQLLRKARGVLFTSEEEKLQARKSFWLYRAREIVVAYGTTTPPGGEAILREKFLAAFPELKGKRVLLFLSRIHYKKGCDLLIRAFAKFAQQDPDLHLVIAGPDQTGWKTQLDEIASAMGVEKRITWPGLLQGDSKWGAFYSSEAFVLPSHQENFGIAVAEALACGLPVLISDKVNIWREIESDKAGFVAPDTLEGTERILEQWISAPAVQRAEMQQAARSTFERRYTIDAMAQGLLDVIHSTKDPVSGVRSA